MRLRTALSCVGRRPASAGLVRPGRAIRLNGALSPAGWLWKQEPVINSFRHMTFFNAKQQRNIDVPVAATPIALDGGEIVVASEDGFLRRYTNTFSEVRWETRVNARLYASPTVCEGRNMLIAASTKGHILAVNDDGVLLWRADLKECIYNSPLFCDRSNQIFVSSFNHKLFSLNASTGDLLWKRDLSAPWGNTFHATAGFRDPYAGPAPDFEGGCIQCSAEHISRYDSSGRQLWVKNTGHTVRTTAAISKPANVGLAGSVNGSAFLFDVRTGEIISTHRLNGRLMNSPAIVGDKGCIGSSAGDVVCISSRLENLVNRREDFCRYSGSPTFFNRSARSPRFNTELFERGIHRPTRLVDFSAR